MKLKPFHAPFLARKIALNLTKSGFVTFTRGGEGVAACAERLILAELEKERQVEAKANELIAERQDEITKSAADEATFFWLVKKQFAAQMGLVLDFEERFSDLATRILGELNAGELVRFSVAQNRVKNVIFAAVSEYVRGFGSAEDAAHERLKEKGVKFGTDEWNALYQRYYEHELKNRGLV